MAWKDSGDLIGRRDGCKWCPLEIILTTNQRAPSVLDKKIEKKHPHRELIEQICGKRYDEVCKMKYAAMRTDLSDFDLAQIAAVVKLFCWDYGKNLKRKVKGNEGFMFWAKEQDLGRGFNESYAIRFREVWDLGLRDIGEDDPYQTLSETSLYEIVVSADYETQLFTLEKRKEESLRRNEVGLYH